MSSVEIRDYARELFEEGLTIVPASREKKMPIVRWREWQEKDVPDELVEYWFESANFIEDITLDAGFERSLER